MTRDQILKPGTYSGIPNEIMRSKIVSPIAKLAMGALLNRLGQDRTNCWPGFRTIAKDIGCCLQSAHDAIDELEFVQVIGIDRTKQHHNSNNYIFNNVEEWSQKVAAGEIKPMPPITRKERKERSTRQNARSTPQNAKTVLHDRTHRSTPQNTERSTPQNAPFYTAERTVLHDRTEPPKELPKGTTEDGTTERNTGGEPATQAGQGETNETIETATAAQLWREAKGAGLEMPVNQETKAYCLQVLRDSLIEHPILGKSDQTTTWMKIVRFLMNQKKFNNRSLKWLCTHKRQDDGTVLYNWQLVAQWKHKDEPYFLEQITNTYYRSESVAVLERLIGKVIPKPPVNPLHPFWDNPTLSKYVGTGGRYGTPCVILGTDGDRFCIQFKDGETIYAAKEEVVDRDAMILPPKTKAIEPDDDALAALIAD